MGRKVDVNGVTSYGHRTWSISGRIDEAIKNHQSQEQLIRSLMATYHMTKKATEYRLNAHLRWLKANKHVNVTVSETGHFRIASQTL